MPSPESEFEDRLTYERLTAAIDSLMNQPYAPQATVMVHPNRYIQLDVAGRRESWHDVANPWSRRIRKAWGWLKYWRRERRRPYMGYGDDGERMTLREALAWVKRELRTTTYRAMTEEASAEIRRRIAERKAK